MYLGGSENYWVDREMHGHCSIVTEMTATGDRNVYSKGIEGEERGLFFYVFSI